MYNSNTQRRHQSSEEWKLDLEWEKNGQKWFIVLVMIFLKKVKGKLLKRMCVHFILDRKIMIEKI